jgi:hypothetical protein
VGRPEVNSFRTGKRFFTNVERAAAFYPVETCAAAAVTVTAALFAIPALEAFSAGDDP